MAGNMKFLLATTALIALAACDTSSYREAGAVVDKGHFGAATVNNTAIQTGEQSFVIQLASRFAEEVPSTVNFAFDSTSLDQQSRAILRQQAVWINQFPEVTFRVYGHTDAVGSSTYNYNLGLRRAKAVVKYLGSQGISRSRLEAIVSEGETQPLIVSQDRELKNRRTVTEVSGFVQRHPTILDGKYGQVVYREYVESATGQSTLTGINTSDYSSGGS